MIALDELIKDLSKFEEGYKIKGLTFDFSKIIELEQKMKKLQERTERLRADCNKKCGEIATIKQDAKEDLKKKIVEIKRIDKLIASNNVILNKYLKIINKVLSKLHNLPEKDNAEDINIKTSKTESTLLGFENFLTTISASNYSSRTIKQENKALKNVILDVLPICHRCKDGYLILCKAEHLAFLKLDLIDYLKANSLELIELASNKLGQDSAETYLIKLNQSEYLQLDIVKEFYTRQHKIKYHDQITDMTKFVNEIIIKIKK